MNLIKIALLFSRARAHALPRARFTIFSGCDDRVATSEKTGFKTREASEVKQREREEEERKYSRERAAEGIVN